MKILSITWSYEDRIDLSNSSLYKSFIKNNSPENFINIHFNRNNFKTLEEEFHRRFDYQYEFILYRIFLSLDKFKFLDDDYYVISDTNDVVCLGNINDINSPDNILFSSEAHRYPWNCPDWTVNYSENDNKMRHYLNGGLSVGKRDWYISLFKSIIKNILPLNLKTFGGDQGVYTYHYLSNHGPKIILDKNNELFLCTYSRSYDGFSKSNFPMFVHDNGWNYGSPKFIEKFELLK